MNKYVIVVVIILMFNGTTFGIDQEQLTNENNSINSTPVSGISNDDFWEIFGPLIKQSFNRSSEIIN